MSRFIAQSADYQPPEPLVAHLNIGSNLGDSRLIIETAVAEVFALSEGVRRRSPFYESEPWGFVSPNRFLNIGVEISSRLTPIELLHALQGIERLVADRFADCGNAHRNPDGSYSDRYIDIDIIFYGNLAVDSPELTIPHPHYNERDFVVRPLRALGHRI